MRTIFFAVVCIVSMQGRKSKIVGKAQEPNTTLFCGAKNWESTGMSQKRAVGRGRGTHYPHYPRPRLFGWAMLAGKKCTSAIMVLLATYWRQAFSFVVPYTPRKVGVPSSRLSVLPEDTPRLSRQIAPLVCFLLPVYRRASHLLRTGGSRNSTGLHPPALPPPAPTQQARLAVRVPVDVELNVE